MIVRRSPILYVASVAAQDVNVGTAPSIVTAPRSSVPVAAAAPPAASAMVPVYAVTERSLDAESPSATVVVKTRAVEPDPLEYAAESPLERVSAPLLVTTASPHVHVIVRTSPTPYAPSVAAQDVNVGTAPSTVTVPRSPPVTVLEIAFPAVSFMVAPPAVAWIELTERSLDAESPSATVVVKTIAVLPVPLA